MMTACLSNSCELFFVFCAVMQTAQNCHILCQSFIIIFSMQIHTTVKSSSSPVGKKIAAVHFTTIPANLPQLIKYKENHMFAIFVPVLTTLCTLGLKMLKLFCTLELWVKSRQSGHLFFLWRIEYVLVF